MFIDIDPEQEFLQLTEELWQYVYERDSGLCQNPSCGMVGLEVHHIKYRSAGGKHKANNLCLLCNKCHYREHNVEKLSEKCYLNRVKKNEKSLRQKLV